MEIEAKIARVLSDSSAALNVGIDHGVEVGDRVHVWRNVEIKDPDTGEELGSVRLLRMSLDITSVQDRLSVAQVHVPAVMLGLGMFPKQDKFILSEGVKEAQYVQLSPGDSVTVYVREDSEEQNTEPA